MKVIFGLILALLFGGAAWWCGHRAAQLTGVPLRSAAAITDTASGTSVVVYGGIWTGAGEGLRVFVNELRGGLGLQDLLVVLYFAIHPQNKIVLIEEPESHIHPDMQRRLLYFLKEETSKQFFLTTHSNIFLNYTLIDRVFFTNFQTSISVEDATSRVAILSDLGYSITDNLVSDLIILVEGPTDTPIVEEFLVKLGLFGKFDIKIWPLGGDIMDQLDLSVFSQRYKVLALLDQDPNSRHIRKRFEQKCKDLNIPIHRLTKYSIENYFSLRALREIFKGQIPDTVLEILPNEKLEDQIGIDVKRNNRRISQAMTISEIDNTDLIEFFYKVKTLCENNQNVAILNES